MFYHLEASPTYESDCNQSHAFVTPPLFLRSAAFYDMGANRGCELSFGQYSSVAMRRLFMGSTSFAHFEASEKYKYRRCKRCPFIAQSLLIGVNVVVPVTS
ncbi:unnamed protein product [Rotaria sp. Silwood1]|nr:unnamed protein product [Rotaria sp. Silwood1]